MIRHGRAGRGWLRAALAVALLAISAAVQALPREPVILGDSEPMLGDIPLAPEDLAPPTDKQTPDVVDRSRYLLAGYLDNLSGKLDTFFVDTFFSENILEDDVEGSRARISLYTRRELGDPVDYKFSISVKMVFPNTNERLNLLFQSEEEEAREADPLESVENNNYSAALRFIIQETDQWKTNIDTGIRWKLPPDPFTRFRARRYAFFDSWDLRATQTLFYFASKGWGEDSSVQVNVPLNIEKLLRLNASAGYLLNDDYFKLSYSAGLYHELSSKAGLGFVAGASGDTIGRPTFNGYSASVRYRRQIYKDWVFAEFAPELVWESGKNYETTPVIMFRIESVISK